MEEASKVIELKSEEVQEILTIIPNWIIRWGSVLFLVLILLFLSISWFVKYPDIIEAQVLVTTLIPPQKEYARHSGKIDTIYVADNQNVVKNDILAVLENTAKSNDVFYLKSIVDTIQFGENLTTFPIDELPLFFLGDIQQSFSKFENNYSRYSLNLKLKPFSNEATANTISLSELKLRLQTLRSQYILKSTELEFQKKEVNRNRKLFDKGVISEQKLETKELEILISERDMKNLGLTISQIRESIGSAQKTSKGTEIEKTQEEIKLLKEMLQSFNQLKIAIREWEFKFVLKSEIKGKVSFLSYWNQNQTVSDGDLMFTIIPTNSKVYIGRLRAPSQNSGKIKIGQPVNLKLANYPESEFGMLGGSVKNISLLPDNEGFYLVEVSLPNKLITNYGKELEFRQEMRGKAEIITEDLRLMERFLYQFREILKR